jgi:hypothetical protein
MRMKLFFCQYVVPNYTFEPLIRINNMNQGFKSVVRLLEIADNLTNTKKSTLDSHFSQKVVFNTCTIGLYDLYL